ncbi:MAG: sigma-70 family RNA polymerase sigma factor [Planctomycetota bacterium]
MMQVPDTRPSLLVRIRDANHAEAWNEFSSLYRPVVFALATRHGMTSHDAEDLTQQVLWTVSRAIERFDADRKDARFRTWLQTIARRAIINAVTRGKPDRATGSEQVQAILLSQPERTELTMTLEWDYRREVFQVAAERVRNEVSESTWQAFWRTTVENQTPRDAAKAIGCRVGSIYTSRSRVMQRLRALVQELDFGESDA